MHMDIWLKVVLQYYPELLWFVQTIFRLFYLVLAYSSLLRLDIGCSTFYKKVKAHKAHQKLETFKKVKARNKMKVRKAIKKMKARKDM